MSDYREDLSSARAALLSAMNALRGEMASYPTPVAGCDAQYTHLLVEQERIRRALDALGHEVFVATPRTLSRGAGVESR